MDDITRSFDWPTDGLDEARALVAHVKPLLRDVKPNVYVILQHGFTEMVNNAIDHSGADTVSVQITRKSGVIQIWVSDRGVGVFRKIARHFDLEDDRAAVLELSKGGVTTDPARHTGQGIFFTSRALDLFVIWSYDLCLQRIRERVETMARITPANAYDGTVLVMEIAENSERTLRQVFDEYCPTDEEGDTAFTRTRLAVKLCTDEGVAMARSQGKRLMRRVEFFRSVALDFEGVASIGQSFADEVFRVWATEHSSTEIVVMAASDDVLRVIRQVRNAAGLPQIAIV